jgi:hypothetical protein
MPLRRALLLVPLAIAGGWLAFRWSALPPEIASSFDLEGRPRDATSRESFAVLMLATMLAVALVFGALAAWLPRVPSRWVNLPDKEYWLAPERFAETMARVTLFLDWMGVAMGAFLCVLFVAILEHAVSGGGRLAPWWLAALGLHVAFTIAGLVWLNAPFRARRRELRAAGR